MAFEKYILGQSVDQVLATGQEIKLDIQLDLKSNITNGTIIGTVKDSNGKPVPGATVKVTDDNNTPLMHTETDESGEYSFVNVPANPHYHVLATKAGYTVGVTKQIAVAANQTTTVDHIIDLVSVTTCALLGDVFNDTTKAPIKDVSVEIHDANDVKVNGVITNAYGQYFIPGILPGPYTVIATAQGFNLYTTTINIPSNTSLFSYNITLIPKQETVKGTVNGTIVGDNNIPLSGAYVILYLVTEQGLVPQAVTQTNATGQYLFSGVDAGDYLVKANLFV